MKARELLAILGKAFPTANITNKVKPSQNTNSMLDNYYADGKLAVKGRLGNEDSYHFCNSFRSLSVVV